MPTFTRADLFESEIRRLVEEEMARIQAEIALGNLKSFDDYRFHAGKVAGLRIARDYLDEASENVSKKLA